VRAVTRPHSRKWITITLMGAGGGTCTDIVLAICQRCNGNKVGALPREGGADALFAFHPGRSSGSRRISHQSTGARSDDAQ
jgi:hypothetical protein